jgi:adenylate kinase
MQWLTASALIKSEKQSAIPDQTKFVLDPVGNQELLIRGVRKHVRSSYEGVLLDGHFTLLKPDGEITAIEVDVFAKLGLDTIVVLRDDPISICNRLRERDKQDWAIAIVSAHQDAEINRAHVVASSLGIPIYTVDTLDSDGLVRAIHALEK